MPYTSHLQTAIEAATGAGRLIHEAFGRTISSRTKSNARDLVTEVDVRSQERIIAILKRDFPDIPVLAEEGENSDPGSAKRRELESAEMLWVVDPLDGTTNFPRGIELFSVT